MSKYNTKELLLIWLDSFSELSYNEKFSLYEILKDAESIKRVLSEKHAEISALIKQKLSVILGCADNDYLLKTVKQMETAGITAVTKESKLYPHDLKVVEDAPLVLYCKGDVSLLGAKKFAIVGSRKSLPLSVELSKRYTKAVIDCGFVPVTGIADGVDGTVIETALNGNKVISVFASGIDCVYPKVNAELSERVAKTGLIISEYPLGVAAQKFRFPIRNRIIAALSEGVLIVSGGEKSGTVYTGEYALEYGKTLFAIPYSVGVPSGKTPNDFIKSGAFLTDDPSDLYEFYGVSESQKSETLTEQEKAVLLSIGGGNTHIEKIAADLNVQTYELMPTLSLLEIKGQIVKSGANKYSLIKTIPEE